MANSVASPLRYPGGKAVLKGFLGELILLNNLEGCTYYEPFCGGAGAGLNLLFDGLVENIVINDADPAVYAFWAAVLEHTDDFIKNIDTIPLHIEEWNRQKQIYNSSNKIVELGFAFFYLNRCARSGIVKNGGPIGGYAQNGKYTIGARFNREGLKRRILRIQEYSKSIQVHGLDAEKFIDTVIKKNEEKSFVFFDPPYVGKGGSLYMNKYTNSDHAGLAKKIGNLNIPWVLTYDRADEIRNLYRGFSYTEIPIRYSAARVRNERELLFVSDEMRVPLCTDIGRYQLSSREWKVS